MWQLRMQASRQLQLAMAARRLCAAYLQNDGGAKDRARDVLFLDMALAAHARTAVETSLDGLSAFLDEKLTGDGVPPPADCGRSCLLSAGRAQLCDGVVDCRSMWRLIAVEPHVVVFTSASTPTPTTRMTSVSKGLCISCACDTRMPGAACLCST